MEFLKRHTNQPKLQQSVDKAKDRSILERAGFLTVFR